MMYILIWLKEINIIYIIISRNSTTFNEKDEEYQDEDGETVDEDFLNLACLKKRATLTDYKKACINSMIGALKPNLIKHSQWSSTIITSCKLEALRNAIEKDESFIDTFWDDDNIFLSCFITS